MQKKGEADSFTEFCAVIRLQDLRDSVRGASQDHPGQALVPAVAELQVGSFPHLSAEKGRNGVPFPPVRGEVQNGI